MYADPITEWRLLAGMMTNPEYMHRVLPTLFTEERVKVFHAMSDTYAKYNALSFEGLSISLDGKVPPELSADVTDSLPALADILALAARKRQLYEASNVLKLESQAFKPNETAIRAALDFEAVTPSADATLRTGAQQLLSDLDRKRKGDYLFTRTGFKYLNAMMGGEWQSKSLNIIMAGAGVGKTTFVCNGMYRLASEQNIPSGFFSLEMAKEQIMTRWLADMLSIDGKEILRAERLTEGDVASIHAGTLALQKLPMYVVDDSFLTFEEIEHSIRQLVLNRGVRVVFYDYIQISNHSPFGNDKNKNLGAVARRLKQLAKTLGITVVVLSQKNRDGEGMDAMRDSGEIQATADTIIELAPHDDDGGDTDGVRAIDVIFHKNRFGPLGRNTMLFNGKYQRFAEA